MVEEQKTKVKKLQFSFLQIGGLALIVTGTTLLLGSYLQTGWLALLLFPLGGLLFLGIGARERRLGLIIPGGLLTGLGTGLLGVFGMGFDLSTAEQIGWVVFSFAIGWALISLVAMLCRSRSAWWALVPGGIIASFGLTFISSDLELLDFVLNVVTGVGVVLLSWGVLKHLFGLIIPGSLLLGIGPGVYFAWGTNLADNALAKTGIMLVWFALGWALIILFSRVVTAKFVWWPAIPGGVFAMVGWGLYIGGSPGNALNFIGNTGSIGLIIFGLYLLLLRTEFRR